jgi:hypothetical protein
MVKGKDFPGLFLPLEDYNIYNCKFVKRITLGRGAGKPFFLLLP